MATNPVITNPTKNGTPMRGAVTIPIDSIHYFYSGVSIAAFITESGVYQGTCTPDTEFPELTCLTISDNLGRVIKPTFPNTLYVNPSTFVSLISSDGIVELIEFTWGRVTINETLAVLKAQIVGDEVIVCELPNGKTMYASPDFAQYASNQVTIDGNVIPCLSVVLRTNTLTDYLLWMPFADANIAVPTKTLSIEVNGTTYPLTPTSIASIANVKTQITELLDSLSVRYGVVTGRYYQTDLNGEDTLFSLIITACDATIGDFTITISGGADTSTSFTGLTSSLESPSFTGNVYQAYGTVTDADILDTDFATGVVIAGTTVTFSSPIAVTDARGISEAIHGAIFTRGRVANYASFKIAMAYADTKKSVISAIIGGANVVPDSLKLNFDSGTVVTINFSLLS